MELKLLFQNKSFVAVFKPSKTLSVPSRQGLSDPRPVVGILLQQQLGQKIFPTHRLDEDVSGILLFALTAQSHKSACMWFEHHSLSKTYEAIAPFIPLNEQQIYCEAQTWKSLIVKGKRRAFEAPHGKPSKTKVKFIEITKNGRSKWHLNPITGRSHQLRFEMARHGLPIDGDSLYGSKTLPKSSDIGIYLRCTQLDFSKCPNAKSFELPDMITINGFDSEEIELQS